MMGKRKVSVRLDEKIHDELMRSAEANKKTLSHEMNVRLSDAKVLQLSDESANELRSALVVFSAELSTMNRMLKKRGDNVNQVAKKVNMLKTLSEANEVKINELVSKYTIWQKEEAQNVEIMRKRVEALWQSLK